MNWLTSKNMTPREKAMVASGGLFVVIIGIWLGVYEPAVEHRELLNRKIETKTMELKEVSALAENYLKEKTRVDMFESRIKARPKDFSPLAEMEGLAAAAGVRDNISSMSPKPSQAVGNYTEALFEIKMEKVTLPRLVRFLESVRDSKNMLLINRVSIKPGYEDQSMLDVSMTVAVYEMAR